MRTVMMGMTLAFVSSTALASSWTVDQKHARAGFQVRHMMVSDVYGGFNKFSGTINLDDKDVTKSTVLVEIDPASIDTNEADRDNHLKSPDFFDVAKFPKMTFKSTKVEKTATGLTVTGDLTMKDITKPVVLTVEGPAKEMKNPWGMTVSAVKATGKLNRKDWGLVWNKTLEAGGLLVGDEVTLVIDAELIKAADPAPAAAAAPAKDAKPAAAAKKK